MNKLKSENNHHNSWTFLSNHSHVLICLAKNPEALLREVATEVGITERAVQGIVSDLENAEFIVKSKKGRRNFYTLNRNKHLRHPLEAHCTIDTLLSMVLENIHE